MPVYKTKRGSKITWFYQFQPPGATRDSTAIKKRGFASRQAAIDGEAERRLEEQKKYELIKNGAPKAAPALPTTLAMLLKEFFTHHAEEKLAPLTVDRYRVQAACLAPELLAMPLAEIKPLHLSREWTRLLTSGGHHRHTKEARPLAAKTVRNIAGIVSSAFSRAVIWMLVDQNPVKYSEPPIPKKRRGVALTATQQALLLESGSGFWCIQMFLQMGAALGARRGELLALRWSDIQDGRITIDRSLSQIRHALVFKGTKSGFPRTITIPDCVVPPLEAHRRKQMVFRLEYGAKYHADLDLIFSKPDGTPLKPNDVSSIVSKLCRRLKLPAGSKLHSLRHTHASHLLADGVPMQVVSERLGHSSSRVTAEIYAHMIRGQDDEAAKRWEEYQKRNLPPARKEAAVQ